MEIRKVRKEELEKIHQLEKEWVGHDQGFDDFRKRYRKWPETFIVSTEENEIIGIATGRMEGEKMGLESIGVREDCQKQGIGSKLLKEFERKSKKYAEKVTAASADNIEDFYTSNGYKPVQIMLQIKKKNLPDNYSNEDEITEEKDIDEETKFLYADFDRYSENLRDNLKEKFNAFEVNTIYEKKVKDIP